MYMSGEGKKERERVAMLVSHHQRSDYPPAVRMEEERREIISNPPNVVV